LRPATGQLSHQTWTLNGRPQSRQAAEPGNWNRPERQCADRAERHRSEPGEQIVIEQGCWNDINRRLDEREG